jgi:hypothetical protein
METLLQLLSVGALSMFKFFFGPFLGVKAGLGFLSTYFAAVIGMNLSVLIFSFFGIYIKRFIVATFYRNRRKIFTPGNRRLVNIWQKYGLLGVAFLTPPLLTPPVGTLLASGFGEPRQRIVLFMLVSSALWGIVVCYIAFELKEVPFLKSILG